MKIETTLVTPKLARQLLSGNTGNFRQLEDKRVSLYAREMARGNWHLNGETIKLNGRMLIDGQHRLSAVIKADASVKMVICYDVDAAGFRTIDRGKPRSIAQWLRHEGIKNSTTIASVARLCLFYENGYWHRRPGPFDVTDTQIIEYVTRNEPRLQECISISAKAKRVITQSALAAVLYIGLPDNIGDSSLGPWFVSGLATGADLSDSDAVLHLRNRMNTQTAANKVDREMKRFLLTIAWNKTVLGEVCRNLRIRLSGPNKQAPPREIEKEVV